MVNDDGFCVASANIHHDKFDDEIVILDTLAGYYFSLRGSAIDIWLLVEAHASRAMMVESLAARYEGDREVIIPAVDDCLTQLLEYGLIRKTKANSANPESIPPGPKQALSKPLVECFDDMRDLMLLDPVHEVSEAGWPHRPDQAE